MPRSGALATSEAEQALADSWQQLILLRLKSQKLQLRQQVPRSTSYRLGQAGGHPHELPTRGASHAALTTPPDTPRRSNL